jgi:CheY-like chemotaxis protein
MTFSTPAPQRYTILAVDDEAGIRRALCRTLRRDDWDLLQAASGEEALELLGRAPVDAVITDLVLPGLCGQELLQHVRLRAPDAARILLAGNPADSRAAGALRAGDAERLLGKPWEDAELRVAVSLACDRARIARASRCLGTPVPVSARP